VVYQGEIWLEFDDGTTVHLERGDVVVQSGTRHAGLNKGTKSAPFGSWGCSLVGSKFLPILPTNPFKGRPLRGQVILLWPDGTNDIPKPTHRLPNC
jgi:hypothetical protein